LIEDYNQKKKNTKTVSIEETIKSVFLKNDDSIIKFFNFIKEILFLYSHKMTKKDITEKKLEKLYRIFLRDLRADPTLQDIWILFSVSRERIRQMEALWIKKLKNYYRVKKYWVS